MHEAYSSSMDQRTGGSILFMKLIFRRDFLSTKMDTIIVVLQFLFLEICR